MCPSNRVRYTGDLPARLKDAAHRISDDELMALLAERKWRGRLTAAWFVGLSNRVRFALGGIHWARG